MGFAGIRQYQTDADAADNTLGADVGEVTIVAPGRGVIGPIPRSVFMLSQELAFPGGGVAGTIGVHFQGGGRFRLYNYNAAGTAAYPSDAGLVFEEGGYFVFTVPVARQGGDPTRIPTLREVDAVNGSPLPEGTYELVFEVSGDGERHAMPIPIKLLTSADKVFDFRRQTNELGVRINYVASTRIATWSPASGSTTIHAVFSRHWE